MTPTLSNPLERTRIILRWLLTFIYFCAGILHLYMPEFFMRVVPEWVWWPRETVIFTGICEILGAVALMTPRLRRAAGIMLALYAVCVYPANIKHAIDNLSGASEGAGLLYHVPRLLFQPVIVWWALFAANVTNWPWKRKLRVGDT